jgi:hypothetical protein
MVLRLAFAWIGAAVLFTSPAFGRGKRDPRDIEADKACLSGKVEAGIDLLAELYAESKEATWVYNQGRCWERNARPADAINSFREYLRIVKKITAEEKADVEKHIADCQADLDEAAAKAALDTPALGSSPAPLIRSPEPVTPTPPVPASAPPPAPAPEPTPTNPGLELSARAAPARDAVESPPFYKKWWFWTGAAAVVLAGTVTAVLVVNRSSGGGMARVGVE